MTQEVSDAVLAAALALANCLHALLTPSVDRPQGVLLALSVLTAAPVAWRRTAPFAAGLAFAALLALLVAGDYPAFLAGTLAAVVIIPYSVGANVEPLARAAIPPAAIIVAGWLDDVRGQHPVGQYLATVVLIGTPWVLARVLKRQREQAERLEALTAELEAERDRVAWAAVTEERNRIARELHDVVAHAISVIAVQSAGAESTLSEDPERARRPLRLIQRTSREALLEMRRMLALLRGSSETLATRQPGIDDLPRLIDEVEAAGTPVELRLSGDTTVPPTLGTSAYRIVQECLTNVRKHAGPAATATVVVERDPARLRIVVSDDGAGTRGDRGSGHGLLGIRERVRLYGGTISAVDRPGGGFTVEATIPTEPVSDTP